MSISRSVNLRSPGSGAVCSSASLSSARSIWPSSPSSKASKAALSSLVRDRLPIKSDKVFKNVAKLIDCAPLKYDASVDGVAERPSCESMSATSAELTCPSLSRSMTLNDSRMLCSSGGGILESASLVTDRVKGAGRFAAKGAGLSAGVSNGANLSGGFSNGVDFSAMAIFTGDSFSGIKSFVDMDLSNIGGGVALSRPPSNRAASDAVLSGRTVLCDEDDTLRDVSRVGDGTRKGEVGAKSCVLVVPRVFSHEGGFSEALLVVDWRKFACEKGVVGVSFGFSGELFGVDGRTVDGEASRIDPGLRKGD
jgi:hypothetical protein